MLNKSIYISKENELIWGKVKEKAKEDKRSLSTELFMLLEKALKEE